MAKVTMMVEVRLAWWFWPYANTLIFLCDFFCATPDIERFVGMAERALQVRFAGHSWHYLNAVRGLKA